MKYGKQHIERVLLEEQGPGRESGVTVGHTAKLPLSEN